MSYLEVDTDPEGWADASQFLPKDFDLVFLKIKDAPTVPGWIFGNHWDGLEVKPTHQVLYWKRILQEHEDRKKYEKANKKQQVG